MANFILPPQGDHKPADNSDSLPYQNPLSRRDSLKLMAALAASLMLPALQGCDTAPKTAVTPKGKSPGSPSAGGTEHWPQLELQPITATGYGKDPNLLLPPESPWPLTLTAVQLGVIALLSDLLVPAEGNAPSANQVQVPAVIDEWVSAPYPNQQQDRLTILSALAWLDDEAKLRFNSSFALLQKPQQLAILDDIAYDNAQTPLQFQRIAKAFGRFRNLVVAAYFCTAPGIKEIGYLGNVPIAGMYPGPTAEAYQHLNNTLAELGLTDFAYQPG